MYHNSANVHMYAFSLETCLLYMMYRAPGFDVCTPVTIIMSNNYDKGLYCNYWILILGNFNMVCG